MGESVDYTSTEVIELNDRWVMAQRDHISFAVGVGVLETSVDNSETFNRSMPYAEADKINNAHILKNGNILFTTKDNKIFLTNYNLDFITEKTVIKEDGSEMIPHTPANPAYPGRYFYTHRYMQPSNETDLYLWGNYCNVNYGAAPVNIYYTADFGQTVKVAYSFGQHPNYRDDGTDNGGSTGTVLGNPNNTVIARHTHSVQYCEQNGKWYCLTGDHETDNEIHWLEGTYDSVNDSWTWNVIQFEGIDVIDQRTHLKAIEVVFYGGYAFWNTDATQLIDPNNDANGIYRVPIGLLNDPSKHQKIIDFPENTDYSSNMLIDPKTGILLFSVANITRTSDTASILGIAENYGLGEVQFKEFSGYNFIRWNAPNEKGFFRLDTGKFPTLQDKTFFMKAGFDLFNNL